MPQSELVYDVGLFDGSDTAYYLGRGYSVVAIDANPQMIENARSRFSEEIKQGRLTLVNAGLADGDAEGLTFWVSDVPAWSSFHREIASRNGTPHRAITVPIVKFSDILAQYGVPFYLKIDIEGNDGVCVRALRGAQNLPRYISVESECLGDKDEPSDENVLAMLYSLHDAGYRRFKLLSQHGLTAARPDLIGSYRVRLINSMAHGRLKLPGLSRIAEQFTDRTTIMRRCGYSDFTIESSGPIGDDIPGPWMTFEQAKTSYLRERRRQMSDPSQPRFSFWQDWHAAA